MVVDPSITISVFDLMFNTILMAIYFTISFLYYQGLQYAKEEGRLILRAVSVFFFIAGVRYVALVMIGIVAFSQGIQLTEFDETLYIFRTLSAGALIAGGMYLLYATLKKNPPTKENSMISNFKRS